MINIKRLSQLARKWRKMATLRRKRISLMRPDSDEHSNRDEKLVADKGHFVVYTADNRRFVVPLACLNNCVFKELLNLAEEEFGLSRDGPITLPCDTGFLKSVISLAQSHASKDLKKTLLAAIGTGRCSSSSSFQLGYNNQQLLVNGF